MRRTPPTDAFTLLATRTAAEAAGMTGRLETNARVRFAVATALAQGRVTFHYQPVVHAGRPETPAFHELLARITLPDGRLLPAGAFLPFVEAGPLGREIDRLALAQVIEALEADPSLRLAVNMAPQSAGDADWLALLEAARRRGRAAERLILEVSEDAAMRDAGQITELMNHLRGAGCAFALDDFGAGATGFRHFRDFRFDMVKIDGAFVRGVSRCRDAQVLVECLTAVAQHFEMLTVAECVEDPADAAFLRDLGIDALQGWLYGRPEAEPRRAKASAPAARAAG